MKTSPSTSKPTPTTAQEITGYLWPKNRTAISLSEFSKQLDVTLQHAVNLVNRGQLVPVQKSRPAKRSFMISRESFEQFIRARLSPFDGDAARVGAKAQLKGPSR
jgi:hypothetical protein